MLRLTDIPVHGRRVLIRADFNVPVVDGKVASAARIEMALDSIRLALASGAQVMLMSHLGRPAEGEYDADFSLAPVARYLSKALFADSQRQVPLCADYLQQPPTLNDGEIVVLENVRFNAGEKTNDAALSKHYASLCDVFVMDAFGAAHRAHASTCGVAQHAPLACAGLLLLAELDALDKLLDAPRRPLVAIVGGAKVSTKLGAIEALAQRVDQLIPGGGIANTFLKAAGHNVGNSLYEPGLVAAARAVLEASAERGHAIELPVDVVVAKEFSADAAATVKPADQLADHDMIFDIGPDTIRRYAHALNAAGTIIWNGPVGVFEFDQFAAGTEALGRAIADSDAFSIAGGGETLAAIEKFNLAEKMSRITTGGGAFLELLEGKTLPAVAALNARAL